MAKPKRIILYAINGAGMGHVTRLLAVAKWLRRYCTLLDERTPEILFLTSSDASDILADAGFAAFKIPSKTVARRTELNKLEYRRLAKHFIWNTLGVFSPDLLVVDTFPSGSFDELFQVLDGPFKKSFIFRDVKPEYAARATFRSAARMYDCVVSPHNRPSNVPGRPGAEMAFNRPLRFSGEVLQFERSDFHEREQGRAILGVREDQRLVYISAGGGGDPQAGQQLRSLASAIGEMENVHLLIGAGPLYRGPRISGSNVTWFDGPQVGKFFGAVDGAVCAAGYNTFHELLFARVPTAFFSQEKIADDQAARIAAAEKVGACRWLKNWQDVDQVKSMVSSLLDSEAATDLRSGCESRMAENGASLCARLLLDPMFDSERLEWASRVLSADLAIQLESIVGSSSAIAEWIAPLLPHDQLREFSQFAGIETLKGQLSPAAAKELSQVLSECGESIGMEQFQASLLGLLQETQTKECEGNPTLVSEALRCVLAAMKKQPLANELHQSWTRWVCQILIGVTTVMRDAKVDPNLSVDEYLQLFRMFPKLVSVEATAAFTQFTTFVERQSGGRAFSELSRSLQLLKLKHARITPEVIENFFRPAMTENLK